MSQLCGQGLETRRSSGTGGHRHTLVCLCFTRPPPNETEISDTKSDPRVLPVPQLFPRAQEFPWVLLAGIHQLYFSAEALEANLTRTELKFHPPPVARGLVLLLLELL